jgi:hypothetical protein
MAPFPVAKVLAAQRYRSSYSPTPVQAIFKFVFWMMPRNFEQFERGYSAQFLKLAVCNFEVKIVSILKHTFIYKEGPMKKTGRQFCSICICQE